MGTDSKRNVFDELIADNKILRELGNAHDDREKILDLFAKRDGLYKKYVESIHEPITKAIIDAKKSVIMSDMGLLSAQFDIQVDIAKIISRLDTLEKKVSHIQDQKSS
ncbi:MAG: hypothetical protein ABR515_04365 [Nitrososphaeraceae archaeon]